MKIMIRLWHNVKLKKQCSMMSALGVIDALCQIPKLKEVQIIAR